MMPTAKICSLAAFLLFPTLCSGQQAAPSGNSIQPPSSANSLQPQQPQRYKRVLWFIPNYRTSPTLNPYTPMTPSEKFAMAAQEAFDPGTVALGAFIGGISQASNSNPSFGQGAKGYFRYFGTSYGDLVIGNIMTEGVFPTLLHQDPRYFRRGTGSTWSRFYYSSKQTFWTHNDSGKTGFNYSEIFGNATAVAISNAYYPDNRTARDNAGRLAVQLGLDMAGNVLKEFWPDIDRKFFHRKNGGAKRTGP